MLRKNIFWMVLLLVACDDIKLPTATTNQTTPTSTLTLKWAVIDPILKSKVLESVKQNDGFYKENNRSDNSREISRLGMQIRELVQAATQKCAIDHAEPKTSEQPKLPTLPEELLSGRSDGYPPSRVSNYSYQLSRPELMKNANYRNCLANIEKDQLIQDLKNQEQKIRNKDMLISKHDAETEKLVNDMIENGIKTYAEQHGYQLIINKQYNSISYNRDKVVLDVTNDVLDTIVKQNNLSAK